MADSSNHGKTSPRDQSSSHDHQPSSNTDRSPPAPPPVTAPHMMYYQPGPGGYPPGPHGPPPPFHPYPPPPHGYPQYPPQPQGYNNYPGHAPYYPPQNYHSDVGGRSFIRGFIMCSCFIFTGFFVSTLIMAFILHPKLPLYKVNAMSVENFNTSSVLTGDWSISLAILNPNTKLKGYFSDFKVDVVHDQTSEIAMSFVPNFQLEKQEEKQMDVKASSSNRGNVVSFQKWDLDKMSNEKQGGSITFGLKVTSIAEFKSPSMSTRSMMMLAICDGLKIVFQNNSGTGALDNGGKPVNCTLYM
ncbi:uncharacterized protein LOC127128953 [Lathyrus oleraceus]|uniref:Late embryogenesis abundant protein LEA-2 subgroup domain-containing protein n=1 Tax=Pisum sativum TaxID=3888 RepID=A0A9D5AX74_PEA|nr:uncharacterized protein LOC127128953 [Pisum sativum]KAI5425348.1 hypothetical protein KIW84_031229 [Pisum sativum]